MPIDRGLIDQQLQALGEGSRWWNVRELRDLPAVLDSDERILALTRGKIARPRWLRRNWLILITDRRLLCLRSNADAGWRQFEVPADQITRVSLLVGPRRGRIAVFAAGTKHRLLVPRTDSRKVLSALSFLSTPTNLSGGFTPLRMVRQVIDHIMALPAVALGPDVPAIAAAPSADPSHLEERVESLENQVHRLERQVEFLEQLLRERHGDPRLASATAPTLARNENA